MIDSTCCQSANSFFSDSTGLYFYSAVFQGNMALLGVFGVFIIFKLQDFDNIIDDHFLMASEYVRDAFVSHTGSPIPVKTTSTKHFRESLEEWANHKGGQVGPYNFDGVVQKAKELKDDKYVMGLLDDIDKKLELRKHTVAQAWLPMICTLATVVLSLICLPLAPALHRNLSSELLMIVIVIVVQSIALWKASRYVYGVLAKG